MKLLKRAALPALVLAAVGYGLLLWQGPWWIDGAHLRSRDLQPADGMVITGIRTTLVAVGAGVLAAVGLYYTHRTFQHTRDRDREQAELARREQINGQYVEAIKLLGSENLSQRLGAIYALEGIMRDSERDHSQVVEVLAAFIRTGRQRGVGDRETAPEDIRTAFSVLARRTKGRAEERLDLSETSLVGTIYRDAYMPGTNLEGADLSYTDLCGANLRGANLSEARLHVADLVGADLLRADLCAANLKGADMRNVNLVEGGLDGAKLEGADLTGASLIGTSLYSADLSVTFGLTPEMLASARLDRHTKLPSDLASHTDVIQRIRECEIQDGPYGATRRAAQSSAKR
ncbi:pentapeptide repeat-containing protein [Streptomyces spiramyceticus]|uniref:pentapeptide repeat-containing protein n=1 Tax=Streptomyces spiramyceticus TaxID=299717 RepID=UPI00237BB415|nr:pentapeptide repeat-containing protein [Streptomyces spiramyceticus]